MFEQITKNIGKPICLFIDGQPIIADNFRIVARTCKENFRWKGAHYGTKFTITRASQIVERFNAGALPAPITLVNQQTIGSDFGQDSAY